jgi:hypothetical protein
MLEFIIYFGVKFCIQVFYYNLVVTTAFWTLNLQKTLLCTMLSLNNILSLWVTVIRNTHKVAP